MMVLLGIILGSIPVFSAYHHEGESDTGRFLEVYQDKTGTKLDNCALCHTGGQYVQDGRTVSMGSCQWCHYTYGYDETGPIEKTLNPYGKAYNDHGRNPDAVKAIDKLDSDGDKFSNADEIKAGHFPGDSLDDPNKKAAPSKIYTRAQIEALPVHTEFLLMNTSKSGDFYAEYTGVPLEDLLKNAGILDSATGITVFSPDGWSQYHPLRNDPDPMLYPVFWTYPQALFYYVPGSEHWCNYSAPSCMKQTSMYPIQVENGLKLLLAYTRDGDKLDAGVLDKQNHLTGEGPFRVIVPQKVPCPPDQSSASKEQDVIWPYNADWDHNAGAASRTVTMIRVEPLPAGTTDIDVMESGWSYVDQESIVIYGAISGN